MTSRRVCVIAIVVLVIATALPAQTTVTTSGGVANSVPKFSGGETITNSSITESNGNVGIGTTTPAASLHIFKSASGTIGGQIVLDNNGGAVGNATAITFADGGIAAARAQLKVVTEDYPFAGAFSFQTADFISGAGLIERMRITGAGNIGVGTSSPTSKLEVNGNLKLTSGSGASITFSDGTVQSTAWTGSLCGGDYAEAVDVTGKRTHYEPGDVLVIDPDHPGHFLRAAERYSTRVAGIYSTKPGLVGRRQATTDPKQEAAKVPMAMVGIVPTKVSTENGPIKTGDLLVTSSTPGYAMKGTDRSLLAGAIVGKALNNLASGKGVIEVMVSLQ